VSLALSSFSNVRLLCLTHFWGENLASVLNEWKKNSSNIPGVKVVDDEILLYFFKPIEDSEFVKTPFWFSKKVVGYVPQNDLFKIMDLDAGDCWDSDEFEFETYDQLEAHAKKIQMEARELELQFAPTWAFVLNEGSLCQKARVRLFYEKK
jgi:hypothetical protein